MTRNRLVEQAYPSLSYGDLQNGSQLCDEDRRSLLIRPAAYYGDADISLAVRHKSDRVGAQIDLAYLLRPSQFSIAPLQKRIYNSWPHQPPPRSLPAKLLDLDFHVDAGGQVQLHERIDGFVRRIDDVHQSLVGADLKLVARGLVDVWRA